VREASRPSTAPRRGWSVLALALASAALGALFGVLNHFQPAGSVAFWFNLVIPLAFSVPGAVLVGYRPANPIGWLLCTIGLTSGVALFLDEYGRYAVRTNPGSVPGGVLALWLSSVVGLATLGLVPLLFLLFPDGSLPSPRWRPVAWVAVAAIAARRVRACSHRPCLTSSGSTPTPMQP
jgi:two-component system NarL family sensor kinase